ncbi:MAG TPA: tannase/feruloyl esterase family alpha/beta hydrolase, partial [Bryobacteraceae bacterium]|nr:tannase/feruloyl esterase family alpha/beta hydrolase [Bryobacteraceae bacterium]
MHTQALAAIGAAALMAVTAAPIHAQAFADLKSALADYSKSDLEPHKACEALGKFKSKEIAQINAVAMPASAAAPAHCRVTGLLSPEIAFEVSLPAKWNGRFYMIGNGGLAGEAMDDPGRVAQRNGALQLGFAFAQTNTGHDARKEPSGTFVLNNPGKAIDYAWRAVH